MSARQAYSRVQPLPTPSEALARFHAVGLSRADNDNGPLSPSRDAWMLVGCLAALPTLMAVLMASLVVAR